MFTDLFLSAVEPVWFDLEGSGPSLVDREASQFCLLCSIFLWTLHSDSGMTLRDQVTAVLENTSITNIMMVNGSGFVRFLELQIYLCVAVWNWGSTDCQGGEAGQQISYINHLMTIHLRNFLDYRSKSVRYLVGYFVCFTLSEWNDEISSELTW